MSTPLPAWAAPEGGWLSATRAPRLATLGGLLERFQPLTLAELGEATLLDRVDTKFLVPVANVPHLLGELGDVYRVLEVSGSRMGRYRTRYFDTPDLKLYHDHHAGKLPRYKVRIRTYLDSGDQYLEVKLKTGNGRTHKTRMALGPGGDTLEAVRLEARARMNGSLPVTELSESLVADFARITLVAKDAPERLTIDLGLAFSRGSRVIEFPAVSVVEIKQERHGHAYSKEALRALSLRNEALSKYCLGIASLEPLAKKNRFKRVLARLDRIAREHPLTLEG